MIRETAARRKKRLGDRCDLRLRWRHLHRGATQQDELQHLFEGGREVARDARANGAWRLTSAQSFLRQVECLEHSLGEPLTLCCWGSGGRSRRFSHRWTLHQQGVRQLPRRADVGPGGDRDEPGQEEDELSNPGAQSNGRAICGSGAAVHIGLPG